MNFLKSVYDFITGGSIVAPIGLAVALVCARFGAVPLVSVVAVTLVVSTFERP